MNSYEDFYDGVTNDTIAKMDRMRPYVDLALEQGDAIHQPKPYQLVIDIRLPKKDKNEPKDIQPSDGKTASNP